MDNHITKSNTPLPRPRGQRPVIVSTEDYHARLQPQRQPRGPPPSPSPLRRARARIPFAFDFAPARSPYIPARSAWSSLPTPRAPAHITPAVPTAPAPSVPAAATSMPFNHEGLSRRLHRSRFPPSCPAAPRTYPEAHALAYRTPSGLYMVPPGWRLALVEHVVLPDTEGANGCDGGFHGRTRYDLQLVPVGSVLAGVEGVGEGVGEGEGQGEVEVVDDVVDGGDVGEEGEGERELVDWGMARRELEDFEDEALAERLEAAGWTLPANTGVGPVALAVPPATPAIAPATPVIAPSPLPLAGSTISSLDLDSEDDSEEYSPSSSGSWSSATYNDDDDASSDHDDDNDYDSDDNEDEEDSSSSSWDFLSSHGSYSAHSGSESGPSASGSSESSYSAYTGSESGEEAGSSASGSWDSSSSYSTYSVSGPESESGEESGSVSVSESESSGWESSGSSESLLPGPGQQEQHNPNNGPGLGGVLLRWAGTWLQG